MEQHEKGTKIDLCKYRIELAKSDLKSAKALYELEDYRGANNRAYYAIFRAVNAVHALDERSYKKHKDALANFNKEYVKTEIFDRELGKMISKTQVIRHASDYDDFYIATAKESLTQIEVANKFLEVTEKYCLERIDRELDK